MARAVRYPRGAGPGVVPRVEMTALPIGKGSCSEEEEPVEQLRDPASVGLHRPQGGEESTPRSTK